MSPERMIQPNGVELCTEPFGSPADPPILLIMGTGASMLWWEEGFCRLLADGGRFVIRYDQRDTGRSVSYEPGKPGYTGKDLIADAAGVLDAYELEAAHVVGASAGGALTQLLGLGNPERVRSLTLISTSPALPIGRDLPPPSERFMRFAGTVAVDWSDPESVTEYLVEFSRVLAGGQRRFDEAAARDLVQRDLARARDFAAMQNHDLLHEHDPPTGQLSDIAAPTLVIHGTADPILPIEHGEALAQEIAGAKLLRLEGTGHSVERADWEAIASAVLEHTGAAEDGA